MMPHDSLALRIRLLILIVASGLAITVTALALLTIAALTLFRLRRLYAAAATRLARLILALWGVRVVVEPDRAFPTGQTIYVSNHTSTLDLFVLVALGLPNTRFFLSGFVRKYVPLGIIAYLTGTFFTVPQNRPLRRVRIFQRAERTLRRTGESVYLSPEGGRVTSGEIGHFNKGAFHLASSLKVPIVPFYIAIPAGSDPGKGYDARPGIVRVYVKPPIETVDWRLDELSQNIALVRAMFVAWHQEHREVQHGEPSSRADAMSAALAAN